VRETVEGLVTGRVAWLAERALRGVETASERVAALIMVAIMVIVSGDVIMRYALHRPIVWAYDLISVYLMASVFFLSLSAAYATQHQVAVDIFVRGLGPRGRRIAESATCAVSLPFFALLAWVGATRAYVAWWHGDALAGLIAWPTWPALMLVPLGSGLLVARLTVRLVGHLVSLLTGWNVIPLTPMSGESFIE
jgi:TRAP-type C4-dicarboxylate transport system permease small subunit